MSYKIVGIVLMIHSVKSMESVTYALVLHEYRVLNAIYQKKFNGQRCFKYLKRCEILKKNFCLHSGNLKKKSF